jgi:hypothetical protein
MIFALLSETVSPVGGNRIVLESLDFSMGPALIIGDDSQSFRAI